LSLNKKSYSIMKLNIALTLLTAAAVNADVGYTPVNDVTDHAKFGIDVKNIQGYIKEGNATEAFKLYSTYITGVNSRASDGKTVQGMATKDWAAAGAPDEIKKAYEAVLGENHLDSYTTDAINCDGTFAGYSAKLCSVAATKNLHCTAISYSQYEGEKSIKNSNEKNWDELFAFWHGVYTGSADDDYFLQGGGAVVQGKRDKDFETEYKMAALKALNDGQKAVQAPVDTEALQAAFDALFNAAHVGSFAQATMKYAKSLKDATEQDDIDKYFAEGYTYFRCAAGLFDPKLATFIQEKFDPRLVDAGSQPDVYCAIAKEMAATADIGYGVSINDLNLEMKSSLVNITTDCGITLEAPSKPDSASGTFGYVAAAMSAFAVNLFL